MRLNINLNIKIVMDLLHRERDAQLAELVSLRESLTQAQDRQSRLELEKDEAEMKISELSQDIQMRNNEVQREMRKKVSKSLFRCVLASL